jgi:hypothetical protein
VEDEVWRMRCEIGLAQSDSSKTLGRGATLLRPDLDLNFSRQLVQR